MIAALVRAVRWVDGCWVGDVIGGLCLAVTSYLIIVAFGVLA